MSLNAPLRPPAPGVEQTWLELVQAQVTRSVEHLLELPDELKLGEQWARALEKTRTHVLRPSERGHAALLLAGYGLARGSMTVPARLWRFAAGLELLHVSRRLHDESRGSTFSRNGPPGLHAQLALPPIGEHLSVVVGDHLFARALETMLGASLPGAVEASEYCLRLLRASTVGSYRLEQTGPGDAQGGVRQALRLTRQRMLHRGLPSALVCGAMLAGADAPLRLQLARVGCGLGLALELREELAGLRETSGDFTRGLSSFPLVAAWSRARPEVREELERLRSRPLEDEETSLRLRRLVEVTGAWSATERMAARNARGAIRALTTLPNPQGVRELLRSLVERMASPVSPVWSPAMAPEVPSAMSSAMSSEMSSGGEVL